MVFPEIFVPCSKGIFLRHTEKRSQNVDGFQLVGDFAARR